MRHRPWLAWLRPPRHLIALFVAITTVSASALGWLGWQFVLQDAALADTRAADRRENAVALAVKSLQEQFAQIEADLVDLTNAPESEIASRARIYSRGLAADSVFLVFRNGRMEAEPLNRLLYYPTEPGASDPDTIDATFAEADAREFRHADHAGAIALLEGLSRSDTPSIRVEALVRLARNLRQAGRSHDAETVYDRLARAPVVRVHGIPSDLLARDTLAAIYEERGDRGRLVAEAGAVFADLHNGRWPLARPQYDSYERRARQRLGTNVPPTPQPGAEAIADAAFSLWGEWREGKLSAPRRAVWRSDRSVLVVQRSSPERMVVFLAGPDYVRSSWADGLAQLAETHGARIVIRDDEGHWIAGPNESSNTGTPYSSASTGLPWTLSVVPGNITGTDGELMQRRPLIIGGLLAIGLLVVGGSYLIGRAVMRELAVAQVQSDFVTAVSHEFRTPLTALRQISELLAKGRVPDEEMRRRYYDVLEQESSRLQRLVEGLLKFGRMEAGVAAYQFETVDIAALLRSLVSEFETEARRRGCHVELTATEGVPLLQADSEALSCVVWNLLDNAVKYSPDCGTVWVDLTCTDGDVAIDVRDRGAGISPDDRERIFQKFVRGAAARTLGVPGSGIGLAVSRQIVERHGGTIRLDSEPGKGSTFTVRLPALEAASA